MEQRNPSALVRLSEGLGPVGWRYMPSEVWGEQVLTQDPKTAQLARDMGRDVELLYTEAQMLARVAAECERWKEVLEDRGRIHGESSRIYARLAGAVRAGADDAALSRMLRDEVRNRA